VAEKDKNFKKNMMHKVQMRSICEVLRELYWVTEDPEVRERAVEASRMAKKMALKLLDYKSDYVEEMGYDELDDPDAITEERWAKYRDEVKREIEHPLNGYPKEDSK
jgi:hypothetical protein